MPDSEHSLPPVTVFILFHEKSSEGQWMADFLFRWLRLHRESGLRGDGTSVGLPVYYRSKLKKTGESWVVDPLLEPEKEALHTVVVVLADDHLTSDPHWQSGLEDMASALPPPQNKTGASDKGGSDSRHMILPVMLSRSLDALHFFADRDPLRVFDPSDPIPEADDENAVEAYNIRRGRRLRRGLTEALIRLLHGSVDERLRVFISHAKADGIDVAKRVYDGLASVSKLQPWFDSADLPWGVNPGKIMTLEAARSTGGMIVVLSDTYPNRPWCRHEAARARTPRRIRADRKYQLGGNERLYEVQPTVIVRVQGSDWTRTPPSITQAPMYSWPSKPSLPNLSDDEAAKDPSFATLIGGLERKAELDFTCREEDALGEVVDRLLLELLLARVLQLRVCHMPRPIETDIFRIYLNFLPDAWTLQHILKQERTRNALEFVYPGHGFLPIERKEINETVQALIPSPKTKPRLIPIDALDEDNDGEPSDGNGGLPESRLVGLSASGGDNDVRSAGIGMTHVNDLMVRMTQRLLQDGHRVAYGGTLNDMSNNLTKAVFEAAATFVDGNSFAEVNESASHPHPASDRLSRPPIVNYAAWPHTKYISTQVRGQQLGLCGFELIEPETFKNKRLSDPAFPSESHLEKKEALWASQALTRMRAKMADDCEVRILFSGSTFGWSGAIPGIVEELLAAYHGKTSRILLIGGFGGCTDYLVDYLIDEKASWPSAFDWDAQWRWWQACPNAEKRAKWQAGMNHKSRKEKLTDMRSQLETLRKDIHETSQQKLRLSEIAELRELATSSSTRLISKVAKILRELKD